MAGPRQGMETLVVILGSNNALGSVVEPRAGLDPRGLRRLCRRSSAWPQAWAATCGVRARSTPTGNSCVEQRSAGSTPSTSDRHRPVGHDRAGRPRHRQQGPADVALLPVLHPALDHRRRLRPARDPHITEDEARAIDSAIDAYNETIIASVAAARRDGLDWYLFDMGRCWTGSPPGATSRARGRGRRGGRPTSCRRRCAPSTRCRARGSSGPGQAAAPTGACSPSTGSTRPRSATASSPRRSSRSWSWPGSPSPAVTASRARGRCVVDFDRLLLADTLISRPPAAGQQHPQPARLAGRPARLGQRFLPFVHSPL